MALLFVSAVLTCSGAPIRRPCIFDTDSTSFTGSIELCRMSLKNDLGNVFEPAGAVCFDIPVLILLFTYVECMGIPCLCHASVGTDFDDSAAIALALANPSLDVKLIVRRWFDEYYDCMSAFEL